jgi:glutaminyl-tRNA synthetase
MPTISGLRRRGFPAEGIRDFAAMIGVAKTDSVIEVGQLEHAVRGVLNRTAARRFAVLDPLRVVIENYPEGQVEQVEVPNNPEDPAAGTRSVEFSRELWIEREDFMEEPPARFFLLAPGREVRLRSAYFIRCEKVIKDEKGAPVELRCSYDPATRGGDAPDKRKVKSTLHWVSAAHAMSAEVRLFEHLFTKPDPDEVAEGQTWFDNVNPRSEEVLKDCRLEPALADHPAGFICQLERLGYFCVDQDSRADRPVFNRAVTLKDTWAKIEKKGATK